MQGQEGRFVLGARRIHTWLQQGMLFVRCWKRINIMCLLICLLSICLFQTHLPGYVSKAGDIKASGVSEIVCVSVNDPFVMSAWGKEHQAAGKVRMLADSTGAFTKQIDLGVELPPLGGFRSKRYSMVIEDGTVTSLNVEPDGTGLSCSLADKLKL